MNIDSLLEQIENILDSGTKITLSKKTAVNAEEIRECIAQLREIIPEEVDQAKSITANRSEIIEKAKSDAAASVARAQEKAQTLVEKTEAKSEQIISAANANAHQQQHDQHRGNHRANVEAGRCADAHFTALCAGIMGDIVPFFLLRVIQRAPITNLIKHLRDGTKPQLRQRIIRRRVIDFVLHNVLQAAQMP